MTPDWNPFTGNWCAFCLVPVPVGYPIVHKPNCLTLGDDAMSEEPARHPLLGQRVRIVLARAGEPTDGGAALPGVEYTGRRLEQDLVVIGVLTEFDATREATVVDDDGIAHYCYPALTIEPAELWTLVIGDAKAAKEFALRRGLSDKEWSWANTRGMVSYHLAGRRLRGPARVAVVYGANPEAMSSPHLAREVAILRKDGLLWD